MKTRILYSATFFLKSCRLWDNVEKCGGVREAADENIIRRMRFACWINKVTRLQLHTHAHALGQPHSRTRARANTHTHTHTRANHKRARARTDAHTYTHTEICNTAFQRQQWSREHALLLPYAYIACLVELLSCWMPVLLNYCLVELLSCWMPVLLNACLVELLSCWMPVLLNAVASCLKSRRRVPRVHTHTSALTHLIWQHSHVRHLLFFYTAHPPTWAHVSSSSDFLNHI